MRAWVMVLAAAAGLYGAAGVALMAAGAHKAGASAGPLATTAGTFLLFHAAAILGLCALDSGRGTRIAASLIAAGALLFSGELAAHALAGAQPLPLAAPIGGTLMIVGWLVAAVAAPLALRR